MIFPAKKQQGQYPYPRQNQQRGRLERDRFTPSKAIEGKSIGGITKTLNSVQQILSVVQSSAPFIQEYGPMIKNLPAMYRMMKTFKEMESMDVEGDTVKKDIEEAEQIEKNESVVPETPLEKTTKKHGISKPKLYI